LWAKFLWDNKATSALLVTVLVGVLAMALLPSDASRVATALSSRKVIVMQSVESFVERHEVAQIITTIEVGKNFVVVEGGNRMGKSVAVKAAAARLSHTRTVLWYDCTGQSTLKLALQELYGVERNTVVDHLFSIVRDKVNPPADVQKLVLSRAPTVPEPVLVIERAEQLPVHELKHLLDFARELADGKLGRFVFVFSPSDRLSAISGFGAISRAEVIPVLDFTHAETVQYLSHLSLCGSTDRAAIVYSLVVGHRASLVGEGCAAVLLGCHRRGGGARELLHQHDLRQV
jgi:hypothetical protein